MRKMWTMANKMMALGLLMGLTMGGSSSVAAEPVPMLDVQVAPAGGSRTTVDGQVAGVIRQAYVAALNEAVAEKGKVDVVAVGPRATVVLTEYYDPSDVMTQAQENATRVQAFSGHQPIAGMAGSESDWTGRAAEARIAGYIQYGDQRIPFVETAAAGLPMTWLAAEVGRQAFRRIALL